MNRFLSATLLLVAIHPSAMAAGYDGEWMVEFSTEVGACERSFGWPVAIQNGRVAAANATGFVAQDGLASLTFKAGDNLYRAQGKVALKGGAGAWSSNTAYCGGRWKLIRR